MNVRTALYIKDIVQETADTITIHFARPEPQLDYLSGQFLTLISEINGKEERRAYSLCSSPYKDKNLSITVKRVKGGKMSNYLHDKIKTGDKIIVLPPMGNFKFEPENTQRQIVLIGCGSGIAPLFSIIKSALEKEPTSRVSLIYVNSDRENTIFYEQLEQWSSKFPSRFRVFYYWGNDLKKERSKANFFSKLFSSTYTNSHRINSARLKAILNNLQLKNSMNTQVYLCGPQKLMEMATATIKEIGLPRTVVHKESFYTDIITKNRPQENKQDYQVKILLKGKEHNVEVPAGKSILFAGLESGIDMPFSCQSGNCISCAGKCLSGKVVMPVNEALTEEQVKNGYVLACVGYPTSNDVVIEFN